MRGLIGCRALLIALIPLLLLCGCQDQTSHTDERLTVRLTSEQESVTPGSTVNLGVHFEPKPDWHIYWLNPGDSGLPPKFTWSVPDSVVVDDPLWPYPHRIAVGPLINYGFEELLLPFPAKISGSASGSSIRFDLHVKWLVCKDECVPGEAKLSLDLPLTASAGEPSADQDLFRKTFETLPRPLDRAATVVEEQDDSIILSILPIGGRFLPKSATFFPHESRVISNSAEQVSRLEDNVLKITLKRANNRERSIERIHGILVSEEGFSESGFPKAVSIDTSPDEASGGSGSPLSTSTPRTASGSSGGVASGLLVTLGLAFLGGLFLNLMPCVFPVLSIKILSFVDHANDDPAKTRFHGISFTAGVVTSFWVLAGILLTLRAGGEQLGWGFQLQSPGFVAVMVFVFFALGLLFLSDVALGHSIQRMAGSSKLPTSYIGSFTNGALATAVATPCTGPFMSSALAATLTLPGYQSFMIFTALGLGMSAPYLLLSFDTRLLKLLPRPGAWMETFKQLMAFPLFATVVWLTRVFARQMGMEPLGLSLLMNLLWGLLFIAFAFWSLARIGEARSRWGRMTLFVLGIFSAGVALYVASPSPLAIEASRERAAAAAPVVEIDSYGLSWSSYSPSKIKELVASGRNVYIDFTAEWCITCQVNKQVVFSSERVRELIAEKNIALVRGDWTSMNPQVTEALEQYGRNGVPLNVLLPSGAGRSPVLFPNILTAGIVIEELEKL